VRCQTWAFREPYGRLSRKRRGMAEGTMGTVKQR
jgi:hypothetical protein